MIRDEVLSKRNKIVTPDKFYSSKQLPIHENQAVKFRMTGVRYKKTEVYCISLYKLFG